MPQETKNTPLEGSCASCYGPGFYYPYRDEYLCAECASDRDRWDLSHTHLHDLLVPILEAWRAHWRARGLSEQELNDTIEMIARGDRVAWHPDDYSRESNHRSEDHA